MNKQDQEITFINKMDDNHFMSVQPSRTDVYASIFTKYVGHTNYCLMMTTTPTFSNLFSNNNTRCTQGFQHL